MFDIPTTPPPSVTDPDQDRLVSIAANMGLYGKNKFRGAVAAKYLMKHRLPPNTLETAWNKDEGVAMKVAAAMLDWAKDNGECARTPHLACHAMLLLHTTIAVRARARRVHCKGLEGSQGRSVAGAPYLDALCIVSNMRLPSTQTPARE